MKRFEADFQPWDEEVEDQVETPAAEEAETELTDEDEDAAAPTRRKAATDGVSATDPFGLYLHQMGSIPMLSRPQELELAERLERFRRRYRHAALGNAEILSRVAATFDRIQAGDQVLERSIDEVASLGLTAQQIRLSLPKQLRKLHKLLEENHEEYQQLLRARAHHERETGRRNHRARLRKIVALVEALSPRTEFLDAWVTELQELAARMHTLSERIAALKDTAADRAELNASRKELRELTLRVQATPEELSRLLNVVQGRRTPYQQTRQHLAESNLRLVVTVAKWYRGQGLSFPDLIQEGNSGLMRAVDKYDYRLGWKFGTYATWWIRQGITRALGDHARLVRVPSQQVKVLRALDRVHSELMVQHGVEPTIEQVAAAVGISAAEARGLQTAGHQPTSIDVPIASEQGEGTLQDFLQARESADAGSELDRGLLRERLAEVLRGLPPRYREVIELRFGLVDGQMWSLEEIAQRLGITRERVRQIEARGLKNLRHPDRCARLAEFAGAA